ncbi:T9SS type A sorting domain-containing protein [uncultured Planktosalinus sp.]|uniref:T9SS type A sorting domain-containing protein n=1 Tax=uncultured Planktosalinus sp. TaxID=1810935 RepID=UPI0030DCBE6B
MKFLYLSFCILFLLPFQVISQWQEHLVFNEASVPTLVVGEDIDNDGFVDIIVTERGQNAVFWYKNDGVGNFSTPLLIAQNLQNLTGLAVGDLTGNGYKDVVVSVQTSTSTPPNLRWIEHLDGNGTFAFPQVITESPSTISHGIVLGDIDGDDYLDIIVSASAASDRSITWYRNLGNGSFSTGNVVITNFSNGFGIAVGDINGNGNLDIVSGTPNFQIMAWFENMDGEGNFSEPEEIGSEGIAVLNMHLIDIDDDGDLDLVGSSSGENHIFAWWENLDGQGTFGSERFIELEHLITGIYPADIDSDGDIDLFTLSPGFMRWYENMDGLGNFNEPQLISDSVPFAISIVAGDINNNGKLDPVTALQQDQTIIWFENNVLSTFDYLLDNFVMYPNPANDTLKIKTNQLPDYLIIYNKTGQVVLEKKWEIDKTEIDVSFLTSGIYIVEFIYPTSKEKIRFIKK